MTKVSDNGITKTYTVKIDETFKIEETLFVECDIILTFINGTASGHDIGMEEKGRVFIPSFDGERSKEELIVSWSNIMNSKDLAEGESVIKMKGVANLKDNTITITGEGFTDVTIVIDNLQEPEEIPVKEPTE